MAVFTQYQSAPSGLAYLTGDIMPWHDYVIFRSDENTSVAVYGFCSDDLTWEECTVRELWREDYSNYQVDEYTAYDVQVQIDNPYYAYGNTIGVNYNLPSSANITALCVSAALIVSVLIGVFRLVFSLKRGVRA